MKIPVVVIVVDVVGGGFKKSDSNSEYLSSTQRVVIFGNLCTISFVLTLDIV